MFFTCHSLCTPTVCQYASKGRTTPASSSHRQRLSPSPPPSQSISPILTPPSSPPPPPSQSAQSVLKPTAQVLTAVQSRLIIIERRTLYNVVTPYETVAILSRA